MTTTMQTIVFKIMCDVSVLYYDLLAWWLRVKTIERVRAKDTAQMTRSGW